MKIPNLPTDNLYKFLSIAGIILVIAAIYSFGVLAYTLDAKFLSLSKEIGKAKLEIEKSKEFVKNAVEANENADREWQLFLKKQNMYVGNLRLSLSDIINKLEANIGKNNFREIALIKHYYVQTEPGAHKYLTDTISDIDSTLRDLKKQSNYSITDSEWDNYELSKTIILDFQKMYKEPPGNNYQPIKKSEVSISHNEDIKLLMIEMEYFVQEYNKLGEYFEIVALISVLLILTGSLMSGIGFYQWYHIYQHPADLVAKNQMQDIGNDNSFVSIRDKFKRRHNK